jgi:hypothetical protein
MKRQQKSFSVEIKKSRTQGQRHHLPPRRLFATLPDATSAFIQTAEPQVVSEPMAAPRILPSIIEPVPRNPEPVEPVRRKRMIKSKDAEGQIELDLPADGTRDSEDAPETPSTLEPGLQMDVARTEDESIPPVPEVQVDDSGTSEKKARTRRKKTSEFGEQVETSELASQPSPVPEADSLRLSAVVTPSKAVPSRLTKRQAAAAQLPRNERWKRRLHPATW